MADRLMLRGLRSTRPARLALDPFDTINRGRVGAWDLSTPSSIITEASPANVRGYWTGPSSVSLGRFGRAASFDGTNNYVTVPHRDIYNNTQAVTYSAWIYVRNGGTGALGFLIDRGGSSGHWGLFTDDFTAVKSVRIASVNYDFAITVSLNEWHHLAVTLVNAGAATTVNAYVDGAFAATVSGGALTSYTGPIILGQRTDLVRPFNGLQVVPSLWNRVLQLSEIKRIYRDAYAGLVDPAERLFFAVRVPVALTGVSTTYSAGTVAPATDKPLTGGVSTYSAGSVTATPTLALTGVETTYSAGTVAPSDTVALTGALFTYSAGTVTVGADVTVALTGVATTFSAGSVSTSSSVALAGASITYASGTMTATPTLALTGGATTYSTGSVSPADSVALAGVSFTYSAGTVSPVGDVAVALTGVVTTYGSGTVTAAAAGTLHGRTIRRGRRPVWDDIPIELQPAVSLAVNFADVADVEETVHNAVLRFERLGAAASAEKRMSLLRALNAVIIASVARAAEADDEDALAALM